MNRKIILSILIIITSIILASCKKEEYIDVDQSNMELFINHKDGNIGDVMPFYDGEDWNFFYLHDSVPNPGFHPWYRFSTKNFYEFKDHGEVIPVVHDTTNQELALGTGSVIEKDGKYYAFYTAHNGRLNPKETIRVSVSSDNMETWVKDENFEINPKDPKYNFDSNDFRDPHVVYIPEKEVYYMLFTTRYLNKGAIGYLTSKDLVNWEKEDDGIFFLNNEVNGTLDVSSNLECPTLLFHNGTWYLTFSDQWPVRATHYLYSKDIDGEFIKPTLNVFDGTGLYAGKIAASDSQMLLMGWVSSDFNRPVEFGWGGNFIAHELKQKASGELYVDIISQLDKKISNNQKLTVTKTNTKFDKDKIKFGGNDYEYVIFDDLTGINKITGTINIDSLDDKFGILFDTDGLNSGYRYDLNVKEKLMSFNRGSVIGNDTYNYTNNDLFLTKDQVNFTILFEERLEAAGSIVTLYIENQVALTGRMFRVSDTNFGFYSQNSKLEISNLKLYK
ncbi:glycoside hydrolase family 32 protein [Haploplasma axanthum]|uniref:beta-fructofuranosidase n=1 Tax=Haploplasma axanthum TaxID=29552 RepID=A0A449BFU7_HAPAX|nr:glycoside hydrolase family 32 protein [Haploplasma axanthum]VEU81285.1 Beta-xylosidase [Haploplasma axanthum]